MKKAFLICPVRGHHPAETLGIVSKLESEGWLVHWPPRDTDQEDMYGLRICSDNRDAISAAERVFVCWDGKSQGCLFDLGIAFALNKRITVLSMPDATTDKSFQNMVRKWAQEQEDGRR
ncbi:MAG: hypothetical protein ABFE07_29355 [Armatimonadia bacterium]